MEMQQPTDSQDKGPHDKALTIQLTDGTGTLSLLFAAVLRAPATSGAVHIYKLRWQCCRSVVAWQPSTKTSKCTASAQRCCTASALCGLQLLRRTWGGLGVDQLAGIGLRAWGISTDAAPVGMQCMPAVHKVQVKLPAQVSHHALQVLFAQLQAVRRARWGWEWARRSSGAPCR